jgi:hypothetical protein
VEFANITTDVTDELGEKKIDMIELILNKKG